MTALAPAGELTDDEIFELAAHLDHCDECRKLLREFDRAASIYPFLDLDRETGDSAAPSAVDSFAERDARNRLVALLSQTGLIQPESRSRPGPTPIRPAPPSARAIGWKSVAGIACGVALASGFGIWITHQAREQVRQAEAQSAALLAEMQRAKQKIVALESSKTSLASHNGNPGVDASAVDLRNAETSSALAQLNSVHQADVSTVDELKERLKSLGSALDSARTEAQTLVSEKQELEAKLQESAKSSSVQMAEQQKKMEQIEGRIQDLTRRTQLQQVAIQRQEKLLSTDRDIRDLMGARNLHIIDAADNTEGRQEPWFGRVFYTEGKSLVFYAFDLDQQKNFKRTAAFQVWGEKQGVKAKARSLGMFYLDQKTQDRWILRFEDPETLAQIDRVYITVEPAGGSTTPHGKELLATNLAIPANHP